MDDGSRPEPIEIELTPEDRTHGPARPEPDTPGAELGARPESPRRLVTVALVTGLLALALGWMLGRSGSESTTPAAPASSTTSPPPVTTVDELPGDPIPAVEETESGTDATPDVSPTTTVPDVRVEMVDVHPAVAGRPIELVGRTSGGQLVQFDLATGELRTDTTRRYSGDMYAPIAAGPDWVAMSLSNQETLMLLRDGEEPEPADIGEVWELIRVPRTDRFWRRDVESLPFGSQVFEEISLLDGPTGRRVETRGVSFPVLADPAGALVGSTAGKVYLIDADGSTFLGTGELVAIGADVAVFRDCDEVMRCYVAVLDRTTGERTELATEPSIADSIPPSFWGFPPSMAPTVSPDGEFSVVRTFVGQELVTAVLDLRSGAVTTLATNDFTMVAWSDDGRFVFYTDRATPTAWDSETGEVFRVAEEVSGWNALTLRFGPTPAADG